MGGWGGPVGRSGGGRSLVPRDCHPGWSATPPRRCPAARKTPGPRVPCQGGSGGCGPGRAPSMPLPEPSEQEGESAKAGQEPAPEPGTDVVPAAPRKPKDFSKLVLLTASKDSAKVTGAKRKAVHCIMSLGVPGPATLAKALLKTHPEAQRAIESAPPEPEAKRGRRDAVAEGRQGRRLTGRPAPRPTVEGVGSPVAPATGHPGRSVASACTLRL